MDKINKGFVFLLIIFLVLIGCAGTNIPTGDVEDNEELPGEEELDDTKNIPEDVDEIKEEVKDIPEKLRCNENKDCAPASCCHPNSCINVNYKPDCTGLSCMMSCEPETMDCGQGSCGCENNRCVVKYNE